MGVAKVESTGCVICILQRLEDHGMIQADVRKAIILDNLSYCAHRFSMGNTSLVSSLLYIKWYPVFNRTILLFHNASMSILSAALHSYDSELHVFLDILFHAGHQLSKSPI